MTFDLNGEKFTLTPEMYIVKKDLGGIIRCQAGIMPLDLGHGRNSKPYVILGVQFVQHYFTIYDREKDRVGFATPIFHKKH
jgi:hypothetical protein